MATALGGVRVLELSTAVAGPVAGAVLADMGAEVIKIEQPLLRATTGSTAPPRRDSAGMPAVRPPFYNELHRGKRHLVMDLAHAEGRELFLRLVAVADVVIENFSPRVLPNLRIDYPDLQTAREDVILISMPAFGKSGPYATRGAYGPGIDAMSGLSHLTGYPDRGPGKPANFYCDQHAGVTAAFAALAALRHRRLTGEGQYIELAMLEGELQLLAPAIIDAAVNGRVQQRTGNRHAWMAPHGLYRCRGDDAWVAIAVDSEEQWSALCRAIGRPELAADERYATRSARHGRQDEIDPLIEAWTGERDHREAQARLQSAGVPAGAVLDVAEVHADPHLRHRGSLVYANHEQVGPFPHTRTAWRSRRGNRGVSGPAPLYAEGTDYALTELLGLAGEHVEQLARMGIVVRARQPSTEGGER